MLQMLTTHPLPTANTMQHQEMISMVVSGVPCPPLPTVGQHEASGNEAMFPSHTLLRNVLIHMAYNSNDDVKSQHFQEMNDAQDKLNTAMDNLSLPLYPPEAYGIFCEYMRRVMRSSPLTCNDLRFYPLHHVCIGDTLHRTTCDHAHAHDIHYGLCRFNEHTPSYEITPYPHLVAHYAYRIIWSA